MLGDMHYQESSSSFISIQLNKYGECYKGIFILSYAARANRILYLSDGKILGDLSLAAYKEEDIKSRETQINAWLTSLEW